MLFFLGIVVGSVSYCQRLTIDTPFQELMFDFTARTEQYEVVDYNEQPCALIKVGLVDKSATFYGSVVSSEYKEGEWWVFMTERSKALTIKVQGYTPIDITFEPLKKATTYSVSITTRNGQYKLKDPLIPYYTKVGDEWLLGYLDEDGKIRIPATLKGRGSFFENGTAKVVDNCGMYYININGQTVRRPNWSRCGLHIVKVNNKYGFADHSGRIVIRPIYDYVSDFECNRAIVIDSSRSAEPLIINKQGKTINYRGRICSHFCDNYACVKLPSGSYTFIDTNGVRAFDYYQYAEGFSDGRALVRNGSGKWGFINTRGNVVIPYKKHFLVSSFSDGLAEVTDVTLRIKHVFINAYGSEVFRTKHFCTGFSEGLARAKTYDVDKWGYIDSRGNVAISFQFENTGDFYKGFAKVKLFSPNCWVWINKRGTVLKDSRGVPYISYPE